MLTENILSNLISSTFETNVIQIYKVIVKCAYNIRSTDLFFIFLFSFPNLRLE